jgi:glycosyltransferase involved in cell wall biosynthesis
MTKRYVLITPCRDEAAFLQKTIESVGAQTIAPKKWVIVDDGSTDQTPAILAVARQQYPFIEIIRREDRGKRSVGPGVVDAFYAGLEAVHLDDYDFVCKLDGDLEFKPRYFERLMEIFETDAVLGNLSGKLYLRYGSKEVEERLRDDNAIGPAKFYRVRCLRDIGGFVRQVSWDGIDGPMCRMRGWVPASVREDDLRVIHLRRMGSSEKSFWEGRLRWGRGKYFMGSRWYYVVAVAFYRMFEKPYITSGVGILLGYLRASWRREPRYDDREYLRFLRRYELESLLFGRDRTTRKFNQRARDTYRELRAATPATE